MKQTLKAQLPIEAEMQIEKYKGNKSKEVLNAGNK
jgi:hypothetical protein